MQNKLTAFLSTALLSVGLSGCVVGNQMGHSGNDVYSTFGNIDVIDGERAGDLENNSGNITIGRNAKVRSIDIINGNIIIGDLSEVYSLESVNGNIDIGENVVIIRGIKVVNGSVDIQRGTNIGTDLIASNGDVTLATKSVIKGNIIFENSFLSSEVVKKPSLIITEGTTIEGKIHLHREVIVVLPDSISPNKVIKHYLDNK